MQPYAWLPQICQKIKLNFELNDALKLNFELKIRSLYFRPVGEFKVAHKLSAEGICDGAKLCIREFTCFHTLPKSLRCCVQFSSKLGFTHFCICSRRKLARKPSRILNQIERIIICLCRWMIEALYECHTLRALSVSQIYGRSPKHKQQQYCSRYSIQRKHFQIYLKSPL